MDSDRVLSMLLEKAQFNVARSYATIVGSTANEVTVKEVRLVCSLLLLVENKAFTMTVEPPIIDTLGPSLFREAVICNILG